MNITIINHAFSPALSRHAETRVWLATQRFQDRIPWLTVYLRCGAHGSARAQCRIEAWVRGIGQVISEYRCADPSLCVDIAAARFKHSVLRRLKTGWQTARRWRMRSEPANSRPHLMAGAAT
jgi:hypothetical protein